MTYQVFVVAHNLGQYVRIEAASDEDAKFVASRLEESLGSMAWLEEPNVGYLLANPEAYVARLERADGSVIG